MWLPFFEDPQFSGTGENVTTCKRKSENQDGGHQTKSACVNFLANSRYLIYMTCDFRPRLKWNNIGNIVLNCLWNFVAIKYTRWEIGSFPPLTPRLWGLLWRRLRRGGYYPLPSWILDCNSSACGTPLESLEKLYSSDLLGTLYRLIGASGSRRSRCRLPNQN